MTEIIDNTGTKKQWSPAPELITSLVSYEQDGAGENLYITKTQDIPDHFLADLADRRQASTNEQAGDFHMVASIPIAVVDHLLTHCGYDVMQEPVARTMRILRALDMSHFLATNKTI